MTAGAGRLALVEEKPRGALAEASLPPEMGVLTLGVIVFGVSNRRPPKALTSEISTKSSSSSNDVPLAVPGRSS